jgi:hypothetical protein
MWIVDCCCCAAPPPAVGGCGVVVVVASVLVSLPTCSEGLRNVPKTAIFGKVAAAVAVVIAINMAVIPVVMNTLLTLILNKNNHNIFNNIVLKFGIHKPKMTLKSC